MSKSLLVYKTERVISGKDLEIIHKQINEAAKKLDAAFVVLPHGDLVYQQDICEIVAAINEQSTAMVKMTETVTQLSALLIDLIDREEMEGAANVAGGLGAERGGIG